MTLHQTNAYDQSCFPAPHLHTGPVRNRRRPVRVVRQRDLEHAKLVLGHDVSVRVPVVEVAYQGRPLGARGPLPVRDALLIAREPELLVPPGERLKPALVLFDLAAPLLILSVPETDQLHVSAAYCCTQSPVCKYRAKSRYLWSSTAKEGAGALGRLPGMSAESTFSMCADGPFVRTEAKVPEPCLSGDDKSRPVKFSITPSCARDPRNTSTCTPNHQDISISA